MKPVSLRQELRHPGNLAFALTVLISFVTVFALQERPFSPLELIFLTVLGLVYTLLGILAKSLIEHPNIPLSPISYFLIQVSLASAIFFFSQGNAWLAMMPLAAQAVMMLGRRGMILVNLLILGAVLAIARLLTDDWLHTTQALISFSAAILFVVVFTEVAAREERARAEVERLAGELGAANQKLRAYASQVEELAAAQERNRLAREIHDGLGHYLTAVNMQIQAAAAVLEQDSAQAQASLTKAQSLTQEALQDVRRSIAALRSDPSFSQPLPEALAQLVEECRSSGLVVELTVRGAARPLPPKASLTLYRTAQEGLTNTRKHALASRVDLDLEYTPSAVRLKIEDNGIGGVPEESSPHPADPTGGGFGLFGLRERAQMLGGSLSTHTAPNQGFTLEIEIPG